MLDAIYRPDRTPIYCIRKTRIRAQFTKLTKKYRFSKIINTRDVIKISRFLQIMYLRWKLPIHFNFTPSKLQISNSWPHDYRLQILMDSRRFLLRWNTFKPEKRMQLGYICIGTWIRQYNRIYLVFEKCTTRITVDIGVIISFEKNVSEFWFYRTFFRIFANLGYRIGSLWLDSQSEFFKF